jgi:uncharacterized protein YkuJ
MYKKVVFSLKKLKTKAFLLKKAQGKRYCRKWERNGEEIADSVYFQIDSELS